MKYTKSRIQCFFATFIALLIVNGCSINSREQPTKELSSAQIEDIVRRSYQYVAMYNVINKTAMAPESSPMGTGGWNKLARNTSLFDASIKVIARPNNDTLYQNALLDLREEPMILDVPAFDSKYVSLETSAYDHYVEVPMSTVKGDYQKPRKVLFYTARTKGYKAGDKVPGIDRYLEMSGDFVIAFHRIMPHANEPEKFNHIVDQIESLKLMSLSEYQGKPSKPAAEIQFPEVGKTDADVFGNNLLEVMQFIFNHTTFDPQDELDQELLAAYKPLGVEPGKAWDPSAAAKIDNELFREVAGEVQKGVLVLLNDPANGAKFLPLVFQPKGTIELETLVVQSVLGPIGLPATEAMYPPVSTTDGKSMNALHDYVIKMTKDELPPATAFWSLTLYDSKNGFFIPNQQNKYSVGENAGMKLNKDGGIEIHVAAEKPAGVPDENWLPINRGDEDIDLSLRIYAPDLEKMRTWKAPNAVATPNLKEVAYEAFIYAYPMMEQVKTVNGMFEFMGMKPNVVAMNPKFPMENVGQPIVAPNLTSMTGGVYIDISAGPVTLEIPEVKDRYIVYQFVDVFTHNFYYLGTRGNNGEAGRFTFYNKNQQKPDGNTGTPVLMEGDHAMLVNRIDIKNRTEVDRVHEIQQAIKVVSAPSQTRTYPKYDKEKAFSPAFVDYVNELLTEVPESEKALFARFAAIGIMNKVELSDDDLQEIQEGIDSAFAAIQSESENLEIGNGYAGATEIFGTREFLNGNYLGRAAGAYFGLWGNSKEEANYFMLFTEGEGQIRFKKNELPPLTDIGFWSVTVHDENVLVKKNEYDSYVLTMDQMKFAEDGSLTITISSKPHVENWLFTPGGKMVVLIRAYQADPKKIGDYVPPAFIKTK